MISSPTEYFEPHAHHLSTFCRLNSLKIHSTTKTLNYSKSTITLKNSSGKNGKLCRFGDDLSTINLHVFRGLSRAHRFTSPNRDFNTMPSHNQYSFILNVRLFKLGHFKQNYLSVYRFVSLARRHRQASFFFIVVVVSNTNTINEN